MKFVVKLRLAVLFLLAFSSVAHADTGLDFPGSTAVTDGNTIRFIWADPDQKGFPIWGSNGDGATLIFQVFPRLDPDGSPCVRDWYTMVFWANGCSNPPDNCPTGHGSWGPSYWGMHPWPDFSVCSNGKWYWEIAANNNDYRNNVEDLISTWDQWHWQVIRVWEDSDSSEKHMEFVWDWLPAWDGSSLDPAYENTKVLGASYGELPNAHPVLVVGDAPWNQGEEVYNGIIRGMMFFSGVVLTDAQVETVVQNAKAGGSTPWTTCGVNCTDNVWYANLNPTPMDISDKSGQGHHPSWVGSEKPSLWEGTPGSGDQLPPSAPTNLEVQ